VDNAHSDDPIARRTGYGEAQTCQSSNDTGRNSDLESQISVLKVFGRHSHADDGGEDVEDEEDGESGEKEEFAAIYVSNRPEKSSPLRCGNVSKRRSSY